MKKNLLVLLLYLVGVHNLLAQDAWIRVNQLGYLPEIQKVAVWASKEQGKKVKKFRLRDAQTHKVVYRSKEVQNFGAFTAFESTSRLDFSDFNQTGSFYIESGTVKSPAFRIGNDVYDHTADFVLRYMRQQRCGFNPFLQDSCHTADGFRVFHPSGDSAYVNVVGGWHDASDYLQYVTTSANATFQLLFAYEHNPDAFGDEHDAAGLQGSNGIPDILDEAKWGLDWLLRMYLGKDQMYNQIADDRDHAGYRLPNQDKVNYGKGRQRPVYFITGEPQGMKYKNRATGAASTAGKYTSAFMLGAELLQKYDAVYADILRDRALQAFAFGLSKPGVSQTAPGSAPYFYEEDNWEDDMELAATQLARFTGEEKYLRQAQQFGEKEPVTPWMGADTARHYQWYPFLNLGHYYLASSKAQNKEQFIGFLRQGLEGVYQRGKGNAFQMGVPFIWCSNNLVAAILTQSHLYRQLTGDTRYEAMEASLRDWLFGANPWGTSMIVGLPEKGDYPVHPHSSLTLLHNYRLDGGLVDGPVYGSIFNNLKGLTLMAADEYSAFQSDLVVYHDDFGDYSTNEPTMDGTASLTYYLAAMQEEGKKQAEEAVGQEEQETKR
ncbi:glycoside hydrolase family 9 protein [Pontibacter anaerobius]|uniref:Glycoside hydrolase family 9 protein n=1 Tax=Pontibacter anaerobius TaxID=2993940 RepID=A0ABT3RG65_9BACT|nr:glycoside hydrolase family 9 protein [Pontibacter anaerobius]MCX2740383.1 glycoside hydrolase family 9 protein [Pontibacter anaerobius]